MILLLVFISYVSGQTVSLNEARGHAGPMRFGAAAPSNEMITNNYFFDLPPLSPSKSSAEAWKIVPTWVRTASEPFWLRIDPETYEYYQMDKCGDFISKYKFWPSGRLSKEQLYDDRICQVMNRRQQQ